MAYKRRMDRLPIIPADAKKQNVTCHFCIVGCGYHAYTWPANKQGGTAPDANVFGVDLSQQQYAETDAWYSPSMYNMVKQDGKDVHIVIKPDQACVVNYGLGSVRGARMAELSFSEARNTQQQRLTDPLVWRYGQMQPTSWDDALDLVARVTAAIIKEKGEDALYVSAYDHGGAGGGYENTWGTGKLYFEAMKVKNIRIHNRPAYNSEVHATRDMGVGELNNCYEDAELADTIFCVGANPLETQTNYFLNHWVPNLRGTSMAKKEEQLPDEEHPPARIVFVDPRRTVSINAAEAEAGKDNVLHLAINSGTDLALFNAIFTLHRREGLGRPGVHEKRRSARPRHASTSIRCPGSEDKPGHLTSFEGALEAADDHRGRRKITGLDPADIDQGGRSGSPMPKAGGKRRRTMLALREGPDLGQRQLPHQCCASEHRARHWQHRPAGRRLRPPRRPPGRLRARPERRPCRQAGRPMSTSS
jgi:arsenite oxidase large subunit